MNVSYEEYIGNGGSGPLQNLLLLPTISDVSTTEEWRAVALDLLNRDTSRWRILIVDWPGFGLSDRPRMDYTADSLEGFLADFVTAVDSPLIASGQLLLIYRTSYSLCQLFVSIILSFFYLVPLMLWIESYFAVLTFWLFLDFIRCASNNCGSWSCSKFGYACGKKRLD